MVGAPDGVQPWMPRAARESDAWLCHVSLVGGSRRRGCAAGGVSELFNGLLAAVAQRSSHRPRDLFARARDDCIADGLAPAIVVHRVGVQSEIGEHGRVVEMPRHLLGAAARREVLGAMQRRASVLSGEAQQVGRHDRDRAARALLPWCIGSGLDDDLAYDAPARVVRLAARDQEARERLRQDGSIGL